MKTKILASGISLAVALILTGCDSDSSSSTNDTQDSSGTLTGRFVDSAVANIDYNTDSGMSGKTDVNGNFEFIEGDKVSFHIGKLKLGEAKPFKNNSVVTPKDLAEDNKTLTLMLQLLQSLDEDGNITNGITIPQDVVESLDSLNSEVSIEDLNESEVLELDETLKEKIDKDQDNKIDVTAQKAHNHFNSTLDKLKMSNGKGNGSSNEDRGNGPKNGENNSTSEHNHTGAVVDVFSYEKYELTQEIKDTIAYMGNEERLAYDVYKNLYDTHSVNGDEIKQLINIADKSEIRHIQTVRDLVKKYDINATDLSVLDKDIVGDINTDVDTVRGKYDIKKIQDLYNALMDKGVTSKKDALEVGCMIEVTDVNDLNEDIKIAHDASVKDVEDAFIALREGSYNHYWAFDKGLKNLGVENGCCSLGVIDGVDYCQPNYPKNENH